jgi:hypothetical protein
VIALALPAASIALAYVARHKLLEGFRDGRYPTSGGRFERNKPNRSLDRQKLSSYGHQPERHRDLETAAEPLPLLSLRLFFARQRRAPFDKQQQPLPFRCQGMP